MKKYRFPIKDEFGVIINSFYVNSKVQRKHIAKMLDSLSYLNFCDNFDRSGNKVTYNLLDVMHYFILFEYLKYEHINEDMYKEGKMLLGMFSSNLKTVNQFFQFDSLSEAKMYFPIKQIIE